jgi:hypothetical protein
MKTISKHFTSMKKAEEYQNQLYDKYDYVRLSRSPIFRETGTYVWEIENLIKMAFKPSSSTADAS